MARQRAGRSLPARALLVSAVGVLALATPIAAARVPHSRAASTPAQLLKQGLKFYAGKSITLISPVPAGQQYDIQLRDAAPLMASYLHATINVEDFAVNLAANDTLASSPNNCLTIGGLQPSVTVADQINNTPGLTFTASKMTFLGGLVNPFSVWMVTPQSNIKSFGGLYTYGKLAPVNVMVNPQSSAIIPTRLLLIAFGINQHLLTAYPSIGALGVGFLRGDGQLEQATTTTAVPWIKGNEGIAIASYQTFPKSDASYPYAGQVPTMAQLAKKYPPKTKTEKAAYQAALAWLAIPSVDIAAPPKTPAYCTAALQAAVKYSLQSATVKNEYRAIEDQPGWVSASVQLAALKTGDKLINRIKGLLGYAPAAA